MASAVVVQTTVLLRHDKDLVRDCWVELDSKGPKILCIRQTKFKNQNGCDPETKLFRLTWSEVETLTKVIRSES